MAHDKLLKPPQLCHYYAIIPGSQALTIG